MLMTSRFLLLHMHAWCISEKMGGDRQSAVKIFGDTGLPIFQVTIIIETIEIHKLYWINTKKSWRLIFQKNITCSFDHKNKNNWVKGTKKFNEENKSEIAEYFWSRDAEIKPRIKIYLLFSSPTYVRLTNILRSLVEGLQIQKMFLKLPCWRCRGHNFWWFVNVWSTRPSFHLWHRNVWQ